MFMVVIVAFLLKLSLDLVHLAVSLNEITLKRSLC